MFISCPGIVCSVGMTSATACAAMHAGIAGFSELPYLDNQGEPIIGAIVPNIDPVLNRDQRLVELVSMALTDCLNEQSDLIPEKSPLIVGLAEPDRPGGGADLADTIIPTVQEQLGVRFHPRYSQTIAKGHTAVFEGLRIARDLFAQDAALSTCLVCGADSYINARSMLWLDEHWRLKREYHSDGVIPGEGAGVVQVRRGRPGTGDSIAANGLGFAFEESGVMTSTPLRGDGLTEAARKALAEAKLEMHQIDYRISDVTGEAYAFKELSYSMQRLLRNRREFFPIWHNADSIGDVGAAAGIFEIATALHAYSIGCAPGPVAICHCSSVPGDRAVAVLNAATER